MKVQRAFLCLTILYLDMCYGQRDCTGMECPVLHNCIETVLESGACCPTCTQRGCTCKGYQYYDCIQAGFRRGKVPEGESYFVDFGSTECSCPRGGGKISCHFIPCPEISPNCIDVLQPEDGCPQCRRIGCVHGNKKYEAGHSFQIERCQVCHCPNEGGSLMCSPVPGCGQNMANRPSVSENKYRLKDISGRHDSRQTNHAEPLSNLALGNTLPLYKPDPPSSGTEDSDYTRAQPTSSTFHNLEQPLESTTVPPAHPESSSTSDDGRRHELKQTQSSPNPEESGHADISHNTDPTVSEAHRESLLTAKTSQGATTVNHRPQHGTGERTIRHNSERSRAAQDGVQSATNATRMNKSGRNSSKHHRHSQSEPQSVSNKRQEHEEKPYPTIQFSPTSRPPVRVRDYGEQPRRQAQTLFNYQPQYAERNAEVSSKELLKGCCETGEKWASANGHCNSMEPPTQDWHSICWTAQQQCCLGSLREQQCLSGIKAATGGDTCEKDTGDKCGINSFKECCGCCSLGLHFRSEGHRCEAHPSLGFHCRHIFLTCCEGEEQEEEGPGGHNGWHTVKERPALDPTTAPKKVSDSPFPKEAFLLGQEREGENTVESPVELKDMDECLIHQGNICHHICVNTPGSFRCECFQGYVLQDDAVTCAIETVEDQNRLKEDNRVEPRLPPPPPTEASVPHDPCEGNNRCEQQCTPVGGWPQCSCFTGFVLRINGYSCEDINECLSLHACQLNERCLNTAGSYICQRLITCPTGYHISNDMCEDINECLQESHNCGSDYDCVNTMGSFRCNPKPRCPVGFSKDLQGNCADIDECSLSQPCGPGFNCINTAGSYMCHRKIICSRGYHSSPDGSRCIDVDECQSGLHRCGEGQLCHNMPGSYRCECQTGYQYDSFRRMCVDVNECWRYPGRLCAQTCENTPGSYHCSCTTGFRLSGDGKNCEDVNECLSNPCGQECTNIYGSYQCYCTQGYYLREDGHTCDDIDECSQSIGHLCTYKCVNVAGSYQCACPEYGYTMSPNGRSCRDIDECTTGTHNCSLSETCYNIQGGYRCLSFTCPPNYRSVSDTRCERISCPNYLDCQNSPLRITYYYLSFQSNIVIPAQIFRIGPSPAYSGDNVIVSITQGNDENYFSTRKLNAYTGAVYLHRQVEGPRDFLITVEMKLWRQGTFTTFHARIYVFITGTSL